jgi:carbon-monoxide dehydrogenase medium subunit
VEHPASVPEAVELLSSLAEDGEVLAGGTWIMRAPIRGEPLAATFVSLGAIEELHRIELGEPTVIGAMVTHSELGSLDAGAGPLGALGEAARLSAFEAVRNVATLGGNICSRGFPEADLVPALLASDATVSVASSQGVAENHVATYLASRDDNAAGGVLTAVRIPAFQGRHSWFERLTVRGGGEYAVASVAVSLDLVDGGPSEPRIAVGSVETTARRWPAAERLVTERGLETAEHALPAEELMDGIEARDALDAPGWYRLRVLPVLLRRALARIAVDLS